MSTAEKISSDKQFIDRIFGRFYTAFIIVFLGYFLLNFLGTPLLKYYFLLPLSLTLISTIVFKWQRSFYFVTLFSMIEGQGRVLWGYNPVFRILFDTVLILAVLKNLIGQKKIYDISRIPKFLLFLIMCHFIWFSVELFNPNAAGLLVELSTAKYYIFPFLFFFLLLQNPFDFQDIETVKFFKFFDLVIVLLLILNIYQFYQGSDFMNRISPNFSSLFPKFEVFQGALYRPFGTSHGPGGSSMFLFLTIGFRFLIKNKNSFRHGSLSFFMIATSWAVLLVNQMRSAWIKHFLIMIFAFFFHFVGTKRKFIQVISGVMAVLLLIGSVIFFLDNLQLIDSVGRFSVSVERVEKLGNKDAISKQRAGLMEAGNRVFKRLQRFPIGLGPGMTSSFLPAFGERRREFFDLTIEDYWNLDNLFGAVLTELGLGGFFYIAVIIAIPIYLFFMMLAALKERNMEQYHVLSTAFCVTAVIVSGNWGVNGIPFNPESYFFWIWGAIGINSYFNSDSLKTSST